MSEITAAEIFGADSSFVTNEDGTTSGYSLTKKDIVVSYVDENGYNTSIFRIKSIQLSGSDPTMIIDMNLTKALNTTPEALGLDFSGLDEAKNAWASFVISLSDFSETEQAAVLDYQAKVQAWADLRKATATAVAEKMGGDEEVLKAWALKFGVNPRTPNPIRKEVLAEMNEELLRLGIAPVTENFSFASLEFEDLELDLVLGQFASGNKKYGASYVKVVNPRVIQAGARKTNSDPSRRLKLAAPKAVAGAPVGGNLVELAAMLTSGKLSPEEYAEVSAKIASLTSSGVDGTLAKKA